MGSREGDGDTGEQNIDILLISFYEKYFMVRLIQIQFRLARMGWLRQATLLVKPTTYNH